MNRLFYLLCFSLPLLANFQVFAEFKPTEDLIDRGHCFEFAASIDRLNTLLNHPRLWRYLEMKGYSKSQKETVIFEDNIIANCLINNENGIISITIYFEDINFVREENYKNFIEEHEWFASRVYQIIMSLCREFIYEDISENDVKLIVKLSSIPENQGNTLFVWEKGDVRYFPKFFDPSL